MSSTVISAGDDTIPFVFQAPLIEIQQNWGDGWQPAPELEFMRCSQHASSKEPATCEVCYRYGDVKIPSDTAINFYTPMDLGGWYIRISIVDDDGNPQPQFVGVIESAAKELWGNDEDPAGRQTWTAVDGLRILQKIDVSQAIFIDSAGSLNTVGWVPPMNQRDKEGVVVGNTDTDTDGSNYYGGDPPGDDDSEKWTRTEYINYLINNFVQQDDGPTWTLAGQTDVTDGMNDTIVFPQVASVEQLLHMLIEPKYGIDFNVVYVADDGSGDEGFQITIFALTDQTATFGNATMPSNPNTVSIEKTTQIDMTQTHLVQTEQKKVDKVKVLGKRIVVMGTLAGENAVDSGATTGSLLGDWSDDLEADYVSAGGKVGTSANGSPLGIADYDLIRRREKYRLVFQGFGAPENWDLDGGDWAVATAADGTLTKGDFQLQVRKTLSKLPMKQGWDYKTIPPTDNTEGSATAGLTDLLAWVYDADSLYLPNGGYLQCDLYKMHVSPLENQWGVLIEASPNHRLAQGSFDESLNPPTVNVTDIQFDWTQILATIAIESDHRLAIEYDVPDSLAAGDGSVKTFEDDQAEMWVAQPDTVIGVDETGQVITINNGNGSGTEGNGNSDVIVLRNDIDRLSLIMAGIIARYINERARARFVFRGHKPWADLLGSILSVVQQGDDVEQIGAVITSIEWTMGQSPETIISTGYA